MSGSELLCHLGRNLMVISVDLVPNQHPQNLWTSVLFYLSQPIGTTVKCRLVGHVINQDEGVGGTIVGLGDATEPGERNVSNITQHIDVNVSLSYIYTKTFLSIF